MSPFINSQNGNASGGVSGQASGGVSGNSDGHIDCNAAHSSIPSFIDNEIDDRNLYQAFEIHFGHCFGCGEELTRERENLRQLRALLGNACCETISNSFHEQLLGQLSALAQEQLRQAQQAQQNPFADLGGGYFQSQTVITTSYTHSEIIEDGEIHIQIETTHEIREEY